MKNNKFSSYSFWIAVSGAVVIFLKNLLQVFGVNFDSTAFETIVVSLCGVLVVLGVLTKDDNAESSSKEIEEKETETFEENEFDKMINSLILEVPIGEDEQEEVENSKELEEKNNEQEEKDAKD